MGVGGAISYHLVAIGGRAIMATWSEVHPLIASGLTSNPEVATLHRQLRQLLPGVLLCVSVSGVMVRTFWSPGSAEEDTPMAELWTTSDLSDFQEDYDDQMKIWEGRWVPCRICWSIFCGVRFDLASSRSRRAGSSSASVGRFNAGRFPLAQSETSRRRRR